MKTYSLVSLAEEEDDDEQCGMELNKTMKKIEF